ncbi:indolepyruvate ferredoxin oxidoreductase family protein [Pseudoduganella sp. DS3]|uniref:Indolepyruvate ferredoxin oxidoreductase family protein n=1 Tax=Pseudoduganella guangdongensis TaxID=2692179 RepID=A0A6N9HIY9_9BURK|nr:indolepyruvate ferredoxin oxidoreductase family protein [Pseudoduganella guangdongensis]MYN03247.1 indolepyruvate ferredoxin oxidoreductase family protein [Pseudoduganella guangdongensis]
MQDTMFLSGIQALVQLPMLQRRRDLAAGLKTAGLVSGYRGSPLGAYDQQLWKASKQLAEHDIVFQPGLNEDLAATALWGAQMHKAYGETKVDGVFGIWYGKGPGVDRTGDVFRTANIIGTSALGGVLAVSGDDHAAQSSMYPHQTDGIFHAASIPVLQPANVREVMELGLAGIAMSRYCGLWVGLKTIAEVVETAATVTLDALPSWRTPDIALPPHGLNWDPKLAWPAQRAELERRLLEERLPAARAWARANGIDRSIIAAPQRRFGIITVGKAHQDFMQALDDMQLTRDDLAGMGISVYKVAMSWPLETDGASAFAAGHEEVLVIEEKRANVETQLKDALYGLAVRPRITGKADDTGAVLLPEISEFTPLIVARAVARRFGDALPVLRERLAALDASAVPVPAAVIPVRAPYFCSGCPHNSSTKTPQGSIAGGGIGCHVMSLAQPELKTTTFSQMGGEGLQWVGAAPFSGTGHIFQNLGDGTYQHSGLLAIRAAVAAGTNITYKILYNDAVAMTGGQAAEGVIDPARITRQLHAEGVARIVLVSDDPERWHSANDSGLAPGTAIHHRSELDAVQRTLREAAGVTAIVYEQTCAAEKRRRRKRKAMPDPDRRLFINERVCEGCGDCSVQSNCISVEPLETAYGRKRKINQNACNKDYSCVSAFCPSFIDIEGPRLRRPETERLQALEAELSAALVAPQVPALDRPFNVVVAGIGGTGVLTTGAVLGGAAHVEGKASTVLDFTGLAQKNGAVVSQVRLANDAGQISAVRIGQGAADLLLGADMVVAAAADNAARLSATRSAAVLNLDETPTAQIVRQRDAIQPVSLMRARIKQRCQEGRFHTLHANALAQALFGDTVVVHTLMLGFAWQHGLVPLSLEAIQRTIELNGAAVPLNLSAFKWGRIAACNPGLLERVRNAPAPVAMDALRLDELIAARVADLTAYQDAAYAERYRALVARAIEAEQGAAPGQEEFARNVAISAYRLMAYKDEYEVARLYSSEEFRASLNAQFSGHGKVSIWLAPPLLSRIDPATGRPRKRKFGPWIFSAMRLLARGKGLRGSALDLFGYTEERRAERAMIAQFTQLIEQECQQLDAKRYPAALELARMPQEVRGYGPVKQQAMTAYQAKLSHWQNSGSGLTIGHAARSIENSQYA